MSTSDLFAAAFDSAGAALLLVDRESGRVLDANRAFLEMCGRSRAQVVGQVLWQPPLVADPEAGAGVAGTLRAGGPLADVTLPFETADGRLVLLEIGGREQAGGAIALEARDAGARENARIAERCDAQRLLAARVAGEFTSLQRTLQAAAGLLADCARSGKQPFGETDAVRKGAERAGVIARELLAYGEKSPLQPIQVHLNDLVEAMHLTLQRRLGPDIEVLLDLGANVAPVTADLTHVRQIVLKLAANTREAMERGVFRIQTRNAPPADPALGSVAAGASFAMLAVSDNGPGLDDESWEHLYEPFFTTKPGGQRGLGLAAVHGMVRQMGGRLWVRSEPGQGTSFRIYLPCAASQPAAPPAGQTDHPAARTILLMEPNDGLRTIVAGILKKRGYRVLPARQAREALEIAREQGAPDLLISAPEAKLAADLAALRPHLRTLFLNGHSADDAASATATLAKPFDLETFLGKVRELLA